MTCPREPQGPVVAIVVPIRALADGERPVVRRRPGRPRRVETAPTVDEEVYHQAIAEAVERGIAEDPVVRAVESDNPGQVILAALRAAAVESAALLWVRERAQREGRPGPEVDKLCARRTNALCRLADLTIAKAKLDAESTTIDSEDAERLAGLLVAEVEEVIHEVAPADMAGRFLASLRSQMLAAGHPATWGAAKAGSVKP